QNTNYMNKIVIIIMLLPGLTAQPQPAQVQPAQPQPAQAQSVQAQPTQAQPTQAQPVQTQPVQPQPAQQVQPAQAQPLLRLDSILTVIARSHPALRSSDALARSLDEAAKGARNWEAPQVSTGWWMTPYDPSLWKRQGDGSPGTGQYMVSAEQQFPNRRKQEADEAYMQGMSAVERARKGATENELYAAARRMYYQWVVAEHRLLVLDEDGKLLDFMIRDAELRYKNNLGKIGVYYKAKAELGNLAGRRIGWENTIEQARIALNTLMDRDKGMVFSVDTALGSSAAEPLALSASLVAPMDSAALVENRSDIRAVGERIRLAGLEQTAERAKLRPEFGVRYDHMFGFGGTPMEYTLMATVRLPMASWSSKASKANVASLKWKAQSLEEERDAMVNEATGAAYGLQRALDAKRRQVKVLAEQVLPALRKNFQTLELAYEQNTEELLSLYDAWKTLDDTQLEYWDDMEQILLMQVELKRVLEIK
ncbi:MAG TPA: TolC family protein, partial [Puia sp.]|nr:TolC family protein [Puia sp.]